MDEGKISIRYARALYALAVEKGIEQQVYNEMQILSQAFLEVADLSKTLANPMHTVEEKLSLLTTASGSDISSLLSDFFRFVIKKGREEFMIFIAMSYQDYYRAKQHIVVGKITSTLPLKEESLEKVRQLVKNNFDSTIDLSTKVDPSIIGGFILEVNNFRMDSSIKTELQNIQKELVRA
jgi:ATP synthase, F1 delta subunit